MKTAKRIVSVFMIILTIATSVPVSTFAANGEDYTAETRSEMEYSSTNALGEVLQNAMEDEQSQQDAGYFILDVTVEEDVATVDCVAPEGASVLLAVYNEEGTKLITSAKAEVNSSEEKIEICFDEELPEYFLLKGFMLDSENKPVCKSFETIKYTEAFQKFLEKETTDFEEEKVINLDSSTKNNFAVVSDKAKVIEKTEDKNTLTVNDFDNGIYTFENADSEITSLKEGDVFYYTFGEGAEDYILTKVGSVENKSGTVTIKAADEYEISDFFSYIKIDTEAARAEAKEQSTYTLKRKSGDESDGNEESAWSVEALTISTEGESGNKEYSVTGGIKKIHLSGTANFNFYIKFFYDFNLFGKLHYEFINVLTTVINLSGEISTFGSGEL